MKNRFLRFEFKLEDYGNVIFEEIPLDTFEKYLRENGSVVQDVVQTGLLYQLYKEENSFDFNLLDLIKDDNYNSKIIVGIKEDLDKYKDSDSYIGVNFHILERVSVGYVYTCCYRLKNDNNLKPDFYKDDEIYKILNDIWKNSLNQVNTSQDDGLELFKKLIEEIKNEGKGDVRDYYKINRRRCVALYKENFSEIPIVAFSGTSDCECEMILSKLTENVNSNFLKNLTTISKKIGAILATTKCNVSRYKIYSNKIVRYDRVIDFINRGEKKASYVSCCERKIFAEIEDANETVKSGCLYVKFSPCHECTLAIVYHILNKGNQIKIRVGLE